MDRKGLYGVKDYAIVEIKNNEGEFTLDWLNDVHILRAGRSNAIVVESQLTGEEVEALFDGLKWSTSKYTVCSIRVVFNSKSYATGEFRKVERAFDEMNFVKEISSYGDDSISSFIWVFSNDYEYMKNDINNCIKEISEKKKLSEIRLDSEETNKKLDKLVCGINEINDSLNNDMNRKIKEFAEELAKAVNGKQNK